MATTAPAISISSAMTYGGLLIMVPPPALQNWIEHKIRPNELREFDRPTFPQFGQENIHFRRLEELPIRLNCLRWPVGASDWASFHFLADANDVIKLRQAAYQPSFQPLWLTMESQAEFSGPAEQISTLMWMLPPRHVSDVPGKNDLYLISLVCDRFFWWQSGAAIGVDISTTWTQLYVMIGTALGVTIEADPIPSAYLNPSTDLSSQYENLPTLLDAVAFSCGQRIVRHLDGTVYAQNAETALGIARENVNWEIEVGGAFRFNPYSAGDDLNALAPQSVTVTFPTVLDSVPSGGVAPYVVTLASLELPEFFGVTGYARTKVMRATAAAGYTSGVLQNGTELQELAEQIATDWYRWQLGHLDIKFAGIRAWMPEGLHRVEWNWIGGDLSTHARRWPWDDRGELFSIAGSQGAAGSTTAENCCECACFMWGTPLPAVDGTIEVAAFLQDCGGKVVPTNWGDVEITFTDSYWDATPSPTAVITATDPPVGRILQGEGTSQVKMRSENGVYAINVSSVNPYEWGWVQQTRNTRLSIVACGDELMLSFPPFVQPPGPGEVGIGVSATVVPVPPVSSGNVGIGVSATASASNPNGGGTVTCGNSHCNPLPLKFCLTANGFYWASFPSDGTSFNNGDTFELERFPSDGSQITNACEWRWAGLWHGLNIFEFRLIYHFIPGQSGQWALYFYPTFETFIGYFGVWGPVPDAQWNCGTNTLDFNSSLTIVPLVPGRPSPTMTITVGSCGGNVPIVNSIIPNSGPTLGGTTVTILGQYFTGATVVDFGTLPATTFIISSDTQIIAVSPAEPVGTVDVTVQNNVGISGESGHDEYRYIGQGGPTITKINPNNGGPLGGTTVTITGTNFLNASEVAFGPAAATSFHVISSTLMTAISPEEPGETAGTVDITVTVPPPNAWAGTSPTSLADKFTYLGIPVITSINPDFGPTAGGTTVTIIGLNMVNPTEVGFGIYQTTDFIYVSSSEIIAISPPQGLNASGVNVQVQLAGGMLTLITESDGFFYIDGGGIGPIVSAISPMSGPTGGGTTVTITGLNLSGATQVNFGAGTATSFTVVNVGEITAVSPAEAVGTVNVTVTTPWGTSPTVLADQFSFTAGPVVTSLSVDTGPSTGGTTTTITGSGFTSATVVTFGSVGTAAFNINSDTQITVVTPAEAAATVDTTVTTPAGTSATSSADLFTFVGEVSGSVGIGVQLSTVTNNLTSGAVGIAVSASAISSEVAPASVGIAVAASDVETPSQTGGATDGIGVSATVVANNPGGGIVGIGVVATIVTSSLAAGTVGIGVAGVGVASTPGTTLLYDTFTGTNGTALTSHTMDVGPGWNNVVGTWTIQTNTASNSNTGGGGAQCDIVSNAGSGSTASGTVAWVFVTTPSSGKFAGGLVLWATSNVSTRYYLYPNSGDNKLELYDQTGTQVASGAFTFAASTIYKIGAQWDGTHILGYVNDVQKLSYTPGGSPSNTYFGLHEYRDVGDPYSSNVFDNFFVGQKPALVQSTTGSGTGSSFTINWPAATTKGNFLVVAVGTSNDKTPSATGWNGGRQELGTDNLTFVQLVFKQDAASQSSQVITLSGSDTYEWCAMEFSGINGIPDAAQNSARGSPNSSGSVSSGASGTLTYAYSVVIGALLISSGSISSPTGLGTFLVSSGKFVCGYSLTSATTSLTASGSNGTAYYGVGVIEAFY